MNEGNKRIKMAIIAGAAKAVQYVQKNRNATEANVIKHISENMDEIVENIDNPL